MNSGFIDVNYFRVDGGPQENVEMRLKSIGAMKVCHFSRVSYLVTRHFHERALVQMVTWGA